MLNKEQLARLKKLDRLEPDAVEAVFKPRWNRHNLAPANGRPDRNRGLDPMTIPVKYQALMAVAVALTMQCPNCIGVHSGNARRAGATEAELAEAARVATTLRADAGVTRAMYAWPNKAREAGGNTPL